MAALLEIYGPSPIANVMAAMRFTDPMSGIAFLQAEDRANQLLCSLLPTEQIKTLLERGYITVHAASGREYRITRFGQTDIFKKGRRIESACLQLTIPAPTLDRMIAEYLLLTNDEARYRSTANLFLTQRAGMLYALAVTLLSVGIVLMGTFAALRALGW